MGYHRGRSLGLNVQNKMDMNRILNFPDPLSIYIKDLGNSAVRRFRHFEECFSDLQEIMEKQDLMTPDKLLEALDKLDRKIQVGGGI